MSDQFEVAFPFPFSFFPKNCCCCLPSSSLSLLHFWLLFGFLILFERSCALIMNSESMLRQVQREKWGGHLQWSDKVFGISTWILNIMVSWTMFGGHHWRLSIRGRYSCQSIRDLLVVILQPNSFVPSILHTTVERYYSMVFPLLSQAELVWNIWSNNPLQWSEQKLCCLL